MYQTNRRRLLLAAAAVGLPMSAGCQSETVSDSLSEALDDVSTETINESLVVLRGFEIVAWEVGKRVIWLPSPAIRIIGVSLVISAGVAKLAIEYLDMELKRRTVSENLSQEELAQLETEQSVNFQLDNGYAEKMALGPKTYE